MDSRAYQLNRLSDKQRQCPLDVLESIFKEMTLEEIRGVFQDFAYLAMTTLDEREDNYRGDTLFVIGKIEEIIEAAYLLQSTKKYHLFLDHKPVNVMEEIEKIKQYADEESYNKLKEMAIEYQELFEKDFQEGLPPELESRKDKLFENMKKFYIDLLSGLKRI